MIKTAIILAGGFGTRLREVVSDLPKPMAPVNGRPFLDYLLRYLKHYGIETVILSTGYLAKKITSHYGDKFEGMQIRCSHEEQALGTGGGIRMAMQQAEGRETLVLNGDSFFDVDLKDFWRKHCESGAEASIALRKVDNASRYGSIELNSGNRVVSFQEKKERAEPGLINGGVYLLRCGNFLSRTQGLKAFSVEKDYFARHLNEMHVGGFEYASYFIDIGIPEDYQRAQDDFKGFKY